MPSELGEIPMPPMVSCGCTMLASTLPQPGRGVPDAIIIIEECVRFITTGNGALDEVTMSSTNDGCELGEMRVFEPSSQRKPIVRSFHCAQTSVRLPICVPRSASSTIIASLENA